MEFDSPCPYGFSEARNFLFVFMLAVPYHVQERPEWCGPASLQMALGFFGVAASQEQLARSLGTNTESGTDEDAMEKTARMLGFSVFAGSKKIDDIDEFIRKGIPVIVAYTESDADEGHFSVVVGADDKEIFLYDPEKTAKPVRMKKEFFVSRWKSKYTNKKQWMLALLPRT